MIVPRGRPDRDGYARDVVDRSSKHAVVLGAGGLAREMLQLLSQVDSSFEFRGFVLEEGGNQAVHPGLEIAGDDAWLAEQRHSSDAPSVVLGSGFPRTRQRMLDGARSSGLRLLSLIHPSAVIEEGQVDLGEGAVVCAGVVTTCNVSIGDGALINWNVTVGHDARIGECSVINPGAHISGSVDIGDGVLIGAGAVVLQGVRVGDAATVGAGAVVTRDVPSGETVVGVPARRRNS